MAELQKYRNPSTIQPNITHLSGSITIGAAGAITAQTDTRNSGVTFVKNGTGRYDATIHRAYRRCMTSDAGMVHPTAGSALSLTTGSQAQIQGIAAGAFAGTSGFSTFSICTFRPDTGALADGASGMVITWDLQVSDSQ